MRFTPRYDGLEVLSQKYKDRGLAIVGFPCDQFAHQEPCSDEEIAEFCRINHGVTYPQYLVLLVLWEKDQQPVNDIAKCLLLETNTVTPLLKRMEAEGIVTRSKGKEDARQMIRNGPRRFFKYINSSWFDNVSYNE